MRYTKWAIMIAFAGGLSVAAADEPTNPTYSVAVTTAYEYGNYDYYNVNSQAPTPATAPESAAPAPVPAPPPAGAMPSCAATQSSGENCSSTQSCDSCRHRHGGIFSCWLLDCNDCNPLECCDEDAHRYFGDCCWLNSRDINIYGWADGGIMGNAQSPTNPYNGPVTFPDRDDGQFNQLYGVMERTAPQDNCGWFLGGRVDMLYGSDYIYTTAAGLDGSPVGNTPRWGNASSQYGAAMPQAYVETDYNDLKVKWGHFYTIIGYEVVPAIGNFFYTHAYTHMYGEPFTHTGILASKPYDENWTWYAGIDNGWNAFDCNSRANFLGGVTYADKDWGSLAFAIQTGDESDFNAAGVGPFSNRTMYSIVWTRTLNSRWTYVFEHDLGVQADTQGFNAANRRQADWYGINQYLFYRINCCWTFGARFEWFDDPQGYVVTGLRPGNNDRLYRFPGSFYETSLGFNYKPNANIIIRPEIRYDWYTGPGGFLAPGVPGPPPSQPFNDNFDKNQFLIGIDGIVQF